MQRCPLTAGAEDIRDGVGTAAVGQAWATAAVPMGVHVDRQERFQYSPLFVRDANARFGIGVWCARMRALGC